ncbi:hypothetical protein NP233_g13016 [Leucocoprinus birnbaumii]|uniref:C2H2-type domain-containing protein n=1 Tax=Leucocoprinus birnbaumii TaxID=56174 RepID=A0AAD5YJW3_9AGAR|nr:hypothetical protein NP233_g13016 [Leucocoprinus birnbaumii]
MQCHLCSKIYRDEPTLENHYRAAHGKQKPPLPLLVTAQRYDSQFHNSYFQVTEPISADLPSSEDPINAIFQDMKNAIPKQDGTTEDARLTTPWLMSTKWHIHIKCAPVDDLCEYAAPPTEKEFPRLSSLVLKYYQVISDRYLAEASDLVLQILNTPHPEKTGIVNDPIHSHQNTSTLSKYTATISRLLAFIMRPKPKYPLDIPDDLQTEVVKLAQSITCRDPDQQVIANVHSVLLYLWTNTWHRSQTNTIGDPTICSLVLSGLHRDGTLAHPKDVTPEIAHFFYCMRLTMLQDIYSFGKDDALVRCKEMSIWFTEKHESTFNSLQSLQHRASSIAYTTMTTPLIWWVDNKNWTELLYRGARVSIQAIRNSIADLDAEMIDVWENQVLCGLDVRINYPNICDDTSSKRVGYSFLTDSRNPQLQHPTALLDAIQKHPDLSRKFIKGYTSDGKAIWNPIACHEWLNGYDRFNHLFLVRCHVSVGSCPRGTETVLIQFVNTVHKTTRDVMFLNKALIYLTQYHKGSALTGFDKLIPHVLDGALRDVCIQNLAIARPMAQVFIFITRPNRPDLYTLYDTHLFVHLDRPFDTNDLSAGLKRALQKHVGFDIGTQGWRQIVAAFQRKHSSGVFDLIDNDRHETITALQFGHTRQTENRHYGLSPDALAGPAEDVLPLYVEANGLWHDLIGLPRAGEFCSYKEAKEGHALKCCPSDTLAPESNGLSTEIEKAVFTAMDKYLKGANITWPTAQKLAHQADARTVSTPTSKATYPTPDPTPRVPAQLLRISQPSTAPTPLRQVLSLGALDKQVKVAPLQSHSQINSPSFIDKRKQLEATSGDRSADWFNTPVEGMGPTQPDVSSVYLGNQEKGPGWEPVTRKLSSVTSMDKLPSSPIPITSTPPLLSQETDRSKQALHALRQLLKNENAFWSSPSQRKAVLAVLEYKSDILAILPTGSGKTMLGLIPAMLDSSSRVAFICPLKSLLRDYQRRFNAMELEYEVFGVKDGDRLMTGARIILLTIEAARTKHWESAVAIAELDMPVTRFILDEGQYSFTGNDFRASLRDLWQMRTSATQFIVLSGTIPPAAENAVKLAYGLQDDCVVVRAPSTNRPEHCYIIEPRAGLSGDEKGWNGD